MSKQLTEMTIEELLEAEEDAYADERDVTQFNGDWRPYAKRCAEITEEIDRRGRPRRALAYEGEGA